MMKKGLFFLAFCLICPEVLATVFTVSPLDKSQQYLGLIFGSTVGGINLVASSNNATLSMMFQKFNFIIVTVGAVVLGYLAVTATVNTAREGEAMGKKISMWVPMRALTGMLLMVPGPASGYSVVQMTVLWIVLNGIGAANSIWNVVLTQLSQNVATVSGISLSSLTQPQNLVKSAFYSATCMAAINNMNDLASAPGVYQTEGPIAITPVLGPEPTQPTTNPSNPSQLTLTQSANISVGLQSAAPGSGYDTICGQYTVSVTLSSTDTANSFNIATLTQLLNVKIEAVQAMLTALSPAAQLLAITGSQYVAPDPGYTYAATQAYLGQMAQIATGLQVAAGANANSWEQNPSTSNAISSAYQTFQEAGWIHAGSFYFTMVQATNSTINPQANTLPTNNLTPNYMSNFNATSLPTSWPTYGGNATTTYVPQMLNGSQLTRLNGALNNATNYIASDTTNTPGNQSLSSTSASTGNGVLDSIVQGIASAIQDPIIQGMENIASGNNGTDPLVSMGQFGSALMWGAEIGVFASMLVSFIVTLAGSAVACMNPFPYAITVLVLQIVPVLSAAFISLWTAGATLGIYVPLIPYLIYTTTAFGWLIAVIESMVGAPLIALGLVHPTGEELGRATSGLAILANIFLRPTLMVFGFVMGASLLRAGIALINFGFIPALTQGTYPSMFSILAVIGMYTMLIMAIVNKSFSLVYMLPNQIMRWMGGPAENFDPSDMTGKAKEGFDAGAKKGQAAVEKGGGGAGEKLSNVDSAQKGNQRYKKGQEMKEKQGGGGSAGGGESPAASSSSSSAPATPSATPPAGGASGGSLPEPPVT